VLPIVIAAGGTGGHFFPAEALASELLARGRRVALLTDARSGGLQSPVFAGLEQFVISGAGIAGRGVLRAGKAVMAMAGGVLQARQILTRIHAAAVVGFGGYPCVAPVLATRLMRHRPTVILHEQNAVLGRANRFLARHADRLALSFAATERLPKVETIVTGNPVRHAIEALATLPYAPPTDTIRLLILGGSLGARVFSDVVPAALASLPGGLLSRISIVQQCRAEDLGRVRAAYDLAGIDADLSAFFPDVADKLASAHLVIDDHQSANARALAEARGASVIAQRDFSSDALRDRLAALLATPDMLNHAALAARSIAHADATARLADLVEQLMRQEVRA
jgi:UDP-N-acetylglucosamine--N-acetylmuramyl-(pentapeptide) pyrophosphoryl-undecaprenol N-acetylglucosamine transferase